MDINKIISDIFSYSELESITESLNPLFENLSNDARNWFIADPNRLSLKNKVAFDAFTDEYPQYKTGNLVSNNSIFGKERKKLLNRPIDPQTNTITIKPKAETNSSKIIKWIKDHPEARFGEFCLEFPDMDNASNRTIFNKARVALGLSTRTKKAVDNDQDNTEETSDNTYNGIPLEDEETATPAVNTSGKTLVTDFKGSPVSSRHYIIHTPTGQYPVFDNKLGKFSSTLYPKELVSSSEVAAIRYYLTSNFNLTRDQINDFITNLIYDKKWPYQLDQDTQFDIIKDAVNGKKEAIKLLFLACFQNIAYNYTSGPTPYLGVAVGKATDDDKATYLGLAYQTLAGNFNPNSDTSGCSLHPKKGPLTCEDLLGKNEYPFINFGTRYSQLLQSAIREQLKIESFNGITGKAATSNKTSGTFQYVAATWKSDNKSVDWDAFVADNPYAIWDKFYPGPLTAEHSADNVKFTDPNKIARRQLAFKKAYIEKLQNVSYDTTIQNMNLDSDNISSENDPFAVEDNNRISSEFLQDINDLIHDPLYTPKVNILLQYILQELEAEEKFRTTNTNDEKYKAADIPLSANSYSEARKNLGKLFANYNISMSDFMNNVRDLSPKLVLNFIQNHQ